jgi:predicted transcriptional regulator
MCPDDRNVLWWETAEDHRFALDVLQLSLRREILRFIGRNVKSVDEIANGFCLSRGLAQYHLAMLEKALVIENAKGGYRATQTGILYLERVETKR